MSRKNINFKTLRKVVNDLGETFTTRDVSEDPRTKKVNQKYLYHSQYHAFVGGALSDHRAELNIIEIQKGTSRGSRWKKTGFFSPSFDYDYAYLPVLDLSRGGLRFLAQKELKFKTKLHMKLHIPEEQDELHLKGRVIWTRPNAGFSYKYQIGVQFNTFGIKEGQNSPVVLALLQTLEKSHAEKDEE